MKVLASVVFFCVIILLIDMSERIIAQPTLLETAKPHEVWNDCGTWCETNCDNYPHRADGCIAMCKRGYFCGDGYVRESLSGSCVLPSECPTRSSTTTP